MFNYTWCILKQLAPVTVLITLFSQSQHNLKSKQYHLIVSQMCKFSIHSHLMPLNYEVDLQKLTEAHLKP